MRLGVGGVGMMPTIHLKTAVAAASAVLKEPRPRWPHGLPLVRAWCFFDLPDGGDTSS